MKRPQRHFSIFTMSALDVLAVAMGVFVLFLVILMPYYRKEFHLKAEIDDVQAASADQQAEMEDRRKAAAADGAAAEATRVAREAIEAEIAALEARAVELERRIAAAPPEPTERPVEPPPAPDRRRTIDALDLVFVIDRTRSMTPTLQELAYSIRGVARILERLVPSVRIGVVAYTDRDTGLNPILALALTSTKDDLSRIVTFLTRMEPSERASRTIEEDVFLGVKRAVFMQFRPGARQSVIVIGDAQAHPREITPTLEQISRFVSSGDQRSVSALSVVTPSSSQAGNVHLPFFKAMATSGRGNYHEHSGQMLESVLLSVLVE